MKRRPATEILIVKFEALGDVLRTTCLLEPLQQRGPCRVSWLTSPEASPLLGGNPHLERALTLRLNDPTATARMARRLAGRFDLVLSLEEHPAAAAIAQASCRGELVGVRLEGERLDYTASSARYYDMSLLNRGEDGGLATADAIKASNRRSYARLWIEILGLASSRPGPVLRLNARDRDAGRRLVGLPALRGQGAPLACNFGAGERWPAKKISEAKAVRLLLALGRAFDRPLLLVGGKARHEALRNRRIAAQTARLDPRIRPIPAPYLPLRSFAGLLERCAVVVTTDSLALHMATALGRPAVALVGPTSAAELDFHGRGKALVPPGGCSCFYKARCARPEPCLNEIPDRDVIAQVRRCLTVSG